MNFSLYNLPLIHLLCDFPGFNLHWKKTHGDWKNTEIKESLRSLTLSPLRCGSQYQFYLTAFNKIGTGEKSTVVTASTNGSGMKKN